MAGDIARVQKKGAEGFWGFLSVFLPVAIKELSGDRVRVVLKSQRKGQSSRSSSNLGTSCKVLSAIGKALYPCILLHKTSAQNLKNQTPNM